MTQAIIYCERCGNIIPPSEIGGGKAIVGENAGICSACASNLPAKEREEIRRKLSGETEPEARAATAAGATGRRISARPGPRGAESASARAGPAAAPSSHSGLAIAGLTAGVLVGLAATLLLIGKGRKKTASRPGGPEPGRVVTPRSPRTPTTPLRITPRPPAPRPAPAAPATPAAKRFAEIKHVLAPWFADYTEGRKILRVFLKEFPDAPEAEKVKTRLAEISIGETTRAKEAVAKAVKRAEVLASRGKFGDAAKVLEAVREGFGENEWFKTGGEEKIASALEGVEKSRLDAATRTIAQAGRLLDAKKFDEADRALSERAGWPEGARERAEELVAKIASARTAAENEGKLIYAWLDCLIGFEKAGKTSLAAARSHLERERKRLRELGLSRDKDDRLARIEARFRPTKFVEDMAEISLGNAKGRIRLRWKGESLGMKVVSVEGGVLKAKTTGGREETIPISQMAAEDVVAHARVMRGSTKDPVKAGSYLFLRGEFDAARKVIDGLTHDAALALEEDIDLVASASGERKARQVAKEEAARAAAEAAAEAAKRKALDEARAAGLVAHWTFDEGEGREAADSSGNGNTGWLRNMDDSCWVAGKVGPGALQFDGADDYVAISNEANFDLTEQITVAAWIKVASFTKDWQAIVTKGDNSWRLHRDRKKNCLGWACTGLSHDRWGDLRGRAAVNDGRWHHVAGVYDGTETFLYVDGRADASARASEPIKTTDHPVHIGQNAQRGNRHFHGIIDDVRIYSRALSADDVRSLMEDGR